MTVAELSARMSEREFLEWAAYFRLEPFGPTRDNFHSGLVCALVANMFKGRGGKDVEAMDLVLQPPKPPQTPEEIKTQAWLVHKFITQGTL